MKTGLFNSNGSYYVDENMVWLQVIGVAIPTRRKYVHEQSSGALVPGWFYYSTAIRPGISNHLQIDHAHATLEAFN